MNEQQRLFLVQAQSDYQIFRFLLSENKPACQVLHYLQMATEKLARAYLWKHGVAKKSHAAFSKFVRSVAGDDRVRIELGYKWRDQWDAKLNRIAMLAEAVQQLAPDLAMDGPNLEYPWPPTHPTAAPIESEFPIWDEIQKSSGRVLLDLLDKFFAHASHCF
jgi:hypothetical protein